MTPFQFFRSPYEISLSPAAARAALDFLVRCDIPFYGLQASEETVCFRLYSPYYKEYVYRRGERRFANEHRRRLGLIPLLYRYRHRLGLAAGALFGTLLLFVGSLFVWDITITGDGVIPESVILAEMEKSGLTLGTFIPALDTETLERRLALSLDGVSFVSLNLRGTVVHAELRTRAENPTPLDKLTPSNLVARVGGQITALEITGGATKVTLGKIVKKGELLVSGIIDSDAVGYRTVRARGEVFARTTLSFSAEIPMEITEKIYTGEVKTRKSIKFFGKNLNFFGKDRFSSAFCDTIEETKRLYLFDRIRLPLFLVTKTYAYYEERPRTLTETEALDMAKRELLTKQREPLRDAEILSRRRDITIRDGVLILTETVDCIIDIAEEIKLGTEP